MFGKYLALMSMVVLEALVAGEQDGTRGTSLRYEVNEGDFNGPSINSNRPAIRPPQQYRPERPSNYRPNNNRPLDEFGPGDTGPHQFQGPGNYNPNRPIENEYPNGNGFRPSGGQSHRPDYRPGNDYRPGGGAGYRPPTGSGYRPVTGPNGRPVLTGPVPSWQEHQHSGYKDYDKCKCDHPFNCNTPGIKFGSCDVDKQYCCYKQSHHGGVGGIGGGGIGGIGGSHNRDRPVLVGPSGSSNRPYQNQYNKQYGQYDLNRYSPDRYPGNYDRGQSLDEAYKKGLESAVYESYQRPYNGFNDNGFRGQNGYNDYNGYRGQNGYNDYNGYRGQNGYNGYNDYNGFRGQNGYDYNGFRGQPGYTDYNGFRGQNGYNGYNDYNGYRGQSGFNHGLYGHHKGGKYGLYAPSTFDYYGRSANTTGLSILADDTPKKEVKING